MELSNYAKGRELEQDVINTLEQLEIEHKWTG
jgi:hypothetical protein